jgi:hypothetical protein
LDKARLNIAARLVELDHAPRSQPSGIEGLNQRLLASPRSTLERFARFRPLMALRSFGA